MLVTLRDVLPQAMAEKKAIGAFNTLTPAMAKGVIRAAEELQTPVIIGTAEVLLPYASLQELAYFLVPMAQKASVPVVLHFDHGYTEELVKESIELGFSSVMYDCSIFSYEENLEKVREMARYTHQRHVSIEAELGHVGANAKSAEGAMDSSIYTDCDQAVQFVQETGVDALAIAFGTAHGTYTVKPTLNIGIVQSIHQAISTPLVMHGGSGLSVEEFKESINSGIAKINIFTDIDNAGAKAAAEHYTPGCGYTSLMRPIEQAVYQAVHEKIQIFNNR